MRIIVVIFLFALEMHCITYGQDLTPPFTAITSDFGPRATGSIFHRGIDYGADPGNVINAVEGGRIDWIGWWGNGGWSISISNVNGNNWIYAHMFSGKDASTIPPPSNNMELRNATLVNPNNENDTLKSNVIIFWTGTSNNAFKVITQRSDNWYVRNPDGSYIKNYNGLVNIRTWNNVSTSTGFNIGPVGNSGQVTGPHLHLALNNQEDNPLLLVRRPATPNYTLTIESPNDGEDNNPADGRIVVSNRNGRRPRIRARLSSSSSLDSDKMKFYCDEVRPQNFVYEYSYGGRVGEGRVNVADAQINVGETTRSGINPVSNGVDQFVHIPWDISRIPSGPNHRLYCLAYSVRDPINPVRNVSIPIEIDNTLIPNPIQPRPGDTDFSVDGGGQKTSGAQIIIAFNRPVDPATFDQSRVTFNPPLVGTFTHAWSDSCDTLTMTLTDSETDLRYSTRYMVALSQEIRDTEGEKLDGDGDGFPGGDYVFEFTTRAPQITFSGGVEMFGSMPQSKVVQGTVTNQEPRPVQLAFADTSGSLSGADGDWSYEVALPRLVLAAGETRELGIVHLSHNAGGADAYGVPIEAFASPVSKGRAPGGVRADFMGASTDSGGNGSGSGSGGLGNGPGGDQGLILPGPDDNWSLSDPIYPTPWLVDTRSEIGLLLSGFCSSAGHLLGKYGIKTALVSARDLKVVSSTPRTLNDLKVLILPSGSLRDKEYDQPFWQGISQYVQNGGYLVVLDQPYGNLYSRLPGNPQARGWEEDLSCTGWFTKLEGWHPAMVGQNSRMNNYPTDGYFTWLPYESQIFTRRQLRGGSPSTVIYPYGSGRVMATTCYTDWGYGAGQWNTRSNHLLRDLVTYGFHDESSGQVLEKSPGDTVDLAVTLRYQAGADSQPADRAVVRVLDPYRRVYHLREQALFPPLLPGDSTLADINGMVLPLITSNAYDSVRGLWAVDYRLFSDTLLVQGPEVAKLMGVKTSLTAGDTSANPFFVSMYPLKQNYVVGDTAIFRVNAGSGSAESLEVYVRLVIGIQADSTAPFLLRPDSVMAFDFPWHVNSSASPTMWIHLCRASDRKTIAAFTYGYRVFQRPSLRASATCRADSNWSPGSYVRLGFSAGQGNFSGPCSLYYRYYKGAGSVAERSLVFHYDGQAFWHWADSLVIDSSWSPGQYTLYATFHRLVENASNPNVGYAGNAFSNMMLYPVKVQAKAIADTMDAWSDTLRMSVSVRPSNRVLGQSLLSYQVSVTPYHGQTQTIKAYTDSCLLDSLADGDTLAMPFAVPEHLRKFGICGVKYLIKYGQDSVCGAWSWQPLPLTTAWFDRSSYGWGDWSRANVRIRNESRLDLKDLPIVFLPADSLSLLSDTMSAIWTDSSRLVNLPAGRETTLFFDRALPESAAVGAHNFIAAVLSHGTWCGATAGYQVKYPLIYTVAERDSYRVGDTLRLIAFNSGEIGLHTEYYYSLDDPYQWTNIYYGSGVYDFQPGQVQVIMEHVIDTLPSGTYAVNWTRRELYLGQWREVNGAIYIKINGLNVNVQMATDRSAYFPQDTVEAGARLENRGMGIQNRTLRMTVAPYGMGTLGMTFTPGTSNWKYPAGSHFPEVDGGCRINGGAVELTGTDSLYWVGFFEQWFEQGKGTGIRSSRGMKDLVREIYRGERKAVKENGSVKMLYTLDAQYIPGEGKLAVLNSTPWGNFVTVGDGEYYDRDLSWIWRYAPLSLEVQGNCKEIASSEEAHYIVNADSQRIYACSRATGGVLRSWPVSDPGGCVYRDSKVFVVNRSGNVVVGYDVFGDTSAVIGQGVLMYPGDIAIGGSGLLAVADTISVAYFDLSGNYLGRRGRPKFNTIAIDGKDYLYGQSSNNKMYQYNENGIIMDSVGLGQQMRLAASNKYFYAMYDGNFSGKYFNWSHIYENLGRNRGYTLIEYPYDVLGDSLRGITGFTPQAELNGGQIYYQYGYSYVEPWDSTGYYAARYIPIDSLEGFDFGDYFEYLENIAWHGFFAMFDIMLVKPDGAVSPRISQVDINCHYLKSQETVWQKDTIISLSYGDTLAISDTVGALQDPGQYVIKGSILTDYGEPSLSAKSLPRYFTVSNRSLAISTSTDQPVYLPNETAQITFFVDNRSDTLYDNASVILFEGTEAVWDTTLAQIAPLSSCTLHCAFTAQDTLEHQLRARLSGAGMPMTDRVFNIKYGVPDIWCGTYNFPDSVGARPFVAAIYFDNYWPRPLDINACFRTKTDSATRQWAVLPGYMIAVEETLCVAGDDTVVISIPELEGLTLPYSVALPIKMPVVFANKARLSWDSVGTIGAGHMQARYNLVSYGGWPGAFNLDIRLLDSMGHAVDSSTIRHQLGGNDSICSSWSSSPGYGTHELCWTLAVDSSLAVLDSGRLAAVLYQPDTIMFDSLKVAARCDSQGMVAAALFVTNLSPEPFAGRIGLESELGFPFMDTDVQSCQSKRLDFTLMPSSGPGIKKISAYATTGGDTVAHAAYQRHFKSLLTIESLSPSFEAGIGDTVSLFYRLRNEGTASGFDTVEVKLAELWEERSAAWLAAGQALEETIWVRIPDDLGDQTITGWLATPAQIRPLSLRVQGFNIRAAHSLNRPWYGIGDTIVLSVEVNNRNDRNVKCRLQTQYMGRDESAGFLLAGMVDGAELGDSTRIIFAADSGHYVSGIIDVGQCDSLHGWLAGPAPNCSLSLRRVGEDSTICGSWLPKLDSCRIVQFRLVSPGGDTVEAVNLRRFTAAGPVLDTVIDLFHDPKVGINAAYAFDPAQGVENLLSYGVYTSTARGLWLNTAYVIRGNDSLMLLTDKQIYDHGDTVSVSVRTALTGTMKYSVVFAPADSLKDSLVLAGADTSLSFTLPSEMAAGTRYINYLFSGGYMSDTIYGSRRFDVRGYQITLHDFRLSAGSFRRGDTVRANLNIRSQDSLSVSVGVSLKAVPSGQTSDEDSLVAMIMPGFNWIEIGKAVPIDFKGGPARLCLEFFKGSLRLGGHSLPFTIVIPDSTTPIISLVSWPSNTYDNLLSHRVTAAIADSSAFWDTLHYNTGYGWLDVIGSSSGANLYEYVIPPQPRGTQVAYFVGATDAAGNYSKAPKEGVMNFQVLPALPPSMVAADTSERTVNLTWQVPRSEMAYHQFNPEMELGLPAALWNTPYYDPALLNSVSVWWGDPDSGGLSLSFYSVDTNQAPGLPLYPEVVLDKRDSSSGWLSWNLDTLGLVFTGDFFLGLERPSGLLFGDGSSESYRTYVRDNGAWKSRTVYGNILAGVTLSYPGADVGYQVLRQASDSGYVLLADSIPVFGFCDSTVGLEQRYRYLVQSLWRGPQLMSSSLPVRALVDYVPPLYGDSVLTAYSDSAMHIGISLTDGIGIFTDSMTIYGNGKTVSDSVCGCIRWYHAPLPVIGDTVQFYFTAWDSAGNWARYPLNGWCYVVYTGIGGGTGAGLPTCFGLSKAFPNPSRNGCFIKYQLPKNTPVSLVVYNLAGQRVRTLEEGMKQAGYYQVRWDGRDEGNKKAAAGVYFYRLKTEGYQRTERLVVVR